MVATLNLVMRIELIKLFYQNNNSVMAALRQFRRNHGAVRGPCTIATYRALISKFETTGSVADKKRLGRPRVSDDVIVEVHQAATEIAEQSPLGICSVRRVSKKLDYPISTIRKILRSYLKQYPYHLQIVHELKAPDFESRLQFARQCYAEMITNDNWLWCICFSDEAHFYLNGSVSSRNCRIWAEHHPHVTVQEPLHSPKVTVWCAVKNDFVIGPYFFQQQEDELHEPTTVTVTGARYLQLLQTILVPELQNRGVLQDTIFQQDGAPPHIARPVKTFLQQQFGEKIISRSFANNWPSRSPDLNPLDYWLWGYLKHRVFLRQPHTLAELRNVITLEIAAITPEIIQLAIGNFVTRIDAVIEAEGRQFEQFL